MLENGRGLIKALENWAKKVTSGYRDVNVRDLSTSFRDGLAFCAVIHHYRPDLIDFDSLSKENIFENNSLAFSVAEKQLGVPALLDAEDMVKYAHPDRLSIITYLSQLRNCFENQNKVNVRPGLKRIKKNSSEPPAKISVVEPSVIALKRHEVCQVCKHRVFILERLIVDGKLYHTTCFRCHKCNALLNPGAYVESDTPGIYECSVCFSEETHENLDSLPEAIEQQQTEQELSVSRTLTPKPLPVLEKEFSNEKALIFAKSNLSQGSPKLERSDIFVYKPQNSGCETKQTLNEKKWSDTGTSVKDRINTFEKNKMIEKPFTPRCAVTAGDKLRHSPLIDHSNEPGYSPLSSRISQQSLNSSKSPEKHNGETKSESTVIRDATPKSEICSKEDSDIEASKVVHNSFSLRVVPNVGLKISSSESENMNSIISVSESPNKVTRDIFKSSLPPLKLSLLSSVRKESSNSQVTSPESEKSFHIPQIKSTYPLTLGRSLSMVKQPVEIKTSSSESSLKDSANSQVRDKVVRRSSLESGCESDVKESSYKTLLDASSKTFRRTNSSNEMSCHTENDILKTGLKSYTPLYKSVYSTSNLLSSTLVLKGNTETSEIVPKEGKQSEKDLSGSVNLPNFIEQSKVKSHDETSGSKSDLKGSNVLTADHDTKTLEADEYPDDLNPFGDDETEKNEDEYPDNLNPFGDDTEIVNTSNITVEDYDESKNPFASDEDEEAETLKDASITSYSLNTPTFENKAPNLHNSISSNLSSPSGSLKGTIKKRPAPRPPNVSDIFPKDSGDSGIDSPLSSVKASPSISKRSFQASSPKVRKNKPAPPPPPCVQDTAASVKLTKETDNMKLKSSTVPQPKLHKKKRPAPPVPVSIRRDMKKIPLREIMQEMKEIEEKQREYEKQGREIELLIRDRDRDEEPSVEEEEYILQLFELVNQKNALFRRQAELMYIKRSQRLEEQQYKIEKEIRQLMEKPEAEKTDEDRIKEQELTTELIDIVDQRNSIIDSIEMDRRRELEEDHSVQEQLEIKNGDLPITAEIKQKNKKKKKKEKEKKKKQSEEESGKGTLKRKTLFSKR